MAARKLGGLLAASGGALGAAIWLETTMYRDELLTVEDAAARLKISKHTLNRWRVTGEGPPFVKYGPRLVRYVEVALDEWARLRTRRSTSEPLSIGKAEGTGSPDAWPR